MKYWNMLNMDALWKHYAKWKKQDTEDHILYDSISMKFPEPKNPKRLKVD